MSADGNNPAPLLLNSKVVLIRNPEEPNPDVDLRINFTSKVGGLMGFGSSKMAAKIQFNNNQFYTGEQIELEMEVDNSLCEKNIDFYKMSLVRVVSTPHGMDHRKFYKEDAVTVCQFQGLAKKSFENKKLKITVPDRESKNYMTVADPQ